MGLVTERVEKRQLGRPGLDGRVKVMQSKGKVHPRTGHEGPEGE